MTESTQNAARNRQRRNTHLPGGNYWKQYLEQAHAGCSEVQRHLERLNRIPIGGPVAQECLGISLDVTQIAEAVRALAQIGATHAI